MNGLAQSPISWYGLERYLGPKPACLTSVPDLTNDPVAALLHHVQTSGERLISLSSSRIYECDGLVYTNFQQYMAPHIISLTRLHLLFKTVCSGSPFSHSDDAGIVTVLSDQSVVCRVSWYSLARLEPLAEMIAKIVRPLGCYSQIRPSFKKAKKVKSSR